jgi:hypothetical protein
VTTSTDEDMPARPQFLGGDVQSTAEVEWEIVLNLLSDDGPEGVWADLEDVVGRLQTEAYEFGLHLGFSNYCDVGARYNVESVLREMSAGMRCLSDVLDRLRSDLAADTWTPPSAEMSR